MTSARFRFTPSMLDGETLEELFVARGGLLDAAVAAVRDAGTGDHRAHKLFVGPRGAGKTHLIALVHHRIQALRTDGLRVQVAWLVEDPWDIGSYDEFLAAVLDARTGAPDLAGGDLESHLLASVAEEGPVVVLAENVDRILAAIGADGRRRLRALLENTRALLLVTTATRLSDDVARQDEPFYGFFEVTHLEPLDVADAAAMLIKLAQHEQDAAQVELLERPEATRRLATIAHLAGGQPRVWALLGPALRTSGVEDLVTNLLSRVDDLTPYYQEQLAHLSPQEARVVRRMAAHDRPLTVRDIADLTRVDQRSVSKTISDLRRRGWIRQYRSAITELADKRHSYYVLAEPLARLAFQVKESRGQPIKLVVEFIATWHDGLGTSSSERRDVAAYLQEALHHASESIALARSLSDVDRVMLTHAHGPPPSVARAASELLRRLDDALLALADGEPAPMLELPAPIGQLFEQRLASGSVADARLDVARLATVWAIDWRDRIEYSDTWRLAIGVTQESWFGTPATVAVVVEQLMARLDPDDPARIAARVSQALSLVLHGELALGVTMITTALHEYEHLLGREHPVTVQNRALRDEAVRLLSPDPTKRT